jgi:hypothetical protein
MLSTEYFREIEGTNENGHKAYATIGSPLTLFSEIDGTALASLHFRPSKRYRNKNDKNTKSLIAPFPGRDTEDVQRFQGLINKSDQEIELVITNLNPQGMINFNLMKTLEDANGVNQTNPGGLNEINELHPFQSYAIQCDQMNNLPIILRKYKDEKGEVMTVEKDEQNQKEKKDKSHGTMLFLSVIPDVDHKDLCDRFEKTIWKVSDIIIVKQLPPRTNNVYRGGRQYSDDDYMSLEECDSVEESGNNAIYASFTSTSRPQKRSQSAISRSTVQESSMLIEQSEQLEMNDQTERRNIERVIERGARLENLEILPQSRYMFQERSARIAVPKSIIDDQIVQQSHVAQIDYGDEKIEVNSNETGVNYNYERLARPCIIGLSINEKLEFMDIDIKQKLSELKEEAKQFLKDFKDKKFDEFLKGKIFNSENCSICLCENPDCVLYSCAHNCGHYECFNASTNLNKCPICRSFIMAKLKIDVIPVAS